MSTTTFVLCFVALKVVLAACMWRSVAQGLRVGEKIEQRRRAEREAAAAPPPVAARPRPGLAEIDRPAA